LMKSGYWHFATHGSYDWSKPRQSAVLLAKSERLTMGDLLDRTGLGSPRLVVLSACETGIVDFQRTPDEFTGLPSAFLQAGAAGVVASLWPVDDVSTALLMMRFYDRHRGAGEAPAAALRNAQLWLRDATQADLVAYIARMVREGRLPPPQVDGLTAAIARTGNVTRPYAHPLHWAAFQFYGG
jgi:CHAT domain-containing protein